MKQRIALFWPGDGRDIPNDLALPSITEATTQLEAALRALGREPYRVEGFLTKPHQAIERLGPVEDPMIGVCVHWFYGPHTTDGVVGKDNPLLLASNFSGQWPGLVGLLNTGACLDEPRAEVLARVDGRRRLDRGRGLHGPARGVVHHRRDRVRRGGDRYRRPDVATPRRSSPRGSPQGFRDRRVLILMLGDTSMGMINGYFGPRLLNRHGFTEHKIDQAWIIDRGRGVADARLDEAWPS